MYGFQWRHSDAKYKDMHTDYMGQGVDQLAECIDMIKNDPTSRRIILCAWNPSGEQLWWLHSFTMFSCDAKSRSVAVVPLTGMMV